MKLEWHDNGRKQEKIVTREIPVIIGRSYECDIVLSDPYVSRHHAVAGYEEGSLVLRSMNSRNPITVNDSVELSSGETCVLREGDAFMVGQVKLETSVPTRSPNVNERRTMELNQVCQNCGGRASGATITCVWCGADLLD
jgi:pSer/pThr/pTyr-binding forkhead associated (FHA) protein